MFSRLIAFFRAANVELASMDADTRAALLDFINDSTL